MNDLERLLRLAERQRDERSRIKGRLEGLTKSLKSKGYKGEVQAKKKLAELKTKRKKVKSSFNKKVKAFKAKYAEKLAQADRG